MRTADDRRHEQQLDARAEPRRTAPARAVALSGAALALALAGCGSSNSGNADPATAVPASAPLYISVTVRPTGSLKDSVNAVANKLHISNLSGALVKLVDKSLASDNLTYE